MSVKKVLTSILVVLTFTASLTLVASDDSDADQPITKELSIAKGETKVAYFAFNLTAFEFFDVGDGYSIQFGKDSTTKTVSCSVPELSLDHQLTAWPVDTSKTTLNVSSLHLELAKFDDYGMFSIAVTNNGDEPTNYFNVKIFVRSYGFTQTIEYRFNITVPTVTEYSIEFDSPVLDLEGLFTSNGTLKRDGETVTDLSNYRFYALGLFNGVTIHNDLKVVGRADVTLSPWKNLTPMDLTIAITDVSAKTTSIVEATITYSMDPTLYDLNYQITSGNDVLISNTLPNSDITLLSGTPLLLRVSDGTEASILYMSDAGMTQSTLYSTATHAPEQSLNTTGNGTYQVHFSRYASNETKTVTITVIGSLTPINSIRVTCGAP